MVFTKINESSLFLAPELVRDQWYDLMLKHDYALPPPAHGENRTFILPTGIFIRVPKGLKAVLKPAYKANFWGYDVDPGNYTHRDGECEIKITMTISNHVASQVRFIMGLYNFVTLTLIDEDA